MISIVEDDAHVREATMNLLKSVGFTAACFASAEEFLQSHCVEGTTCLILDVQLPGLGGIELQRRLRDSGNPIPVVFVTAFPEERIRTRALADGAVGFLGKPYDAECLIDCVHKALGRNDRRSSDCPMRR
jgi:FixJ family two-component response regulator